MMPRKKNEKGKLMNAAGQELKTVRLDLPADLHKRLRLEAAHREMSMAQVARIAVEELLAKRKDGGEKKKS
jgi:hypothetical protein